MQYGRMCMFFDSIIWSKCAIGIITLISVWTRLKDATRCALVASEAMGANGFACTFHAACMNAIMCVLSQDICADADAAGVLECSIRGAEWFGLKR